MSRFQFPMLKPKTFHLPARNHQASSSKRNLSKTGGIVAVTGGAVAAATLLGGAMMVGMGVLVVAGLVGVGYWLRARRQGIWAHVLVESHEGSFTIAIPLPLSLARLGLTLAPIPSESKRIALDVLNDAELLRALREEGIEVQVDDGDEHVEVYIGARRAHWPALRLGSIKNLSPTVISLPIQSQKEDTHVG